jgi:hypothetical protein
MIDPGYSMDQVHVYVGTGKYPMKKNGSPTISPGQYGFTADVDNATALTVTFDNVCGDYIYVIAHAVTCDVAGVDGDHHYDVDLDMCTKSAQIAVEEDVNILTSASLKVYPNPFSETVTFEFTTNSNAHVTLEISNLLGQKVATLLDGPVEGGVVNRIEYTPVNETPGMLIYRLIINESIQTGRIIYQQ